MLAGVVGASEEAWVRPVGLGCRPASLPPGWLDTTSIPGAAPDPLTGQGYMLLRGRPSFWKESFLTYCSCWQLPYRGREDAGLTCWELLGLYLQIQWLVTPAGGV